VTDNQVTDRTYPIPEVNPVTDRTYPMDDNQVTDRTYPIPAQQQLHTTTR
jgi:hypothetical protein